MINVYKNQIHTITLRYFQKFKAQVFKDIIRSLKKKLSVIINT